MSAFSSDPNLGTVQDTNGNGAEIDVATNLLTGTVRLSILWTQEILLSPDDAEQVAQALQQAAEHGRKIRRKSSTPSEDAEPQSQPE